MHPVFVLGADLADMIAETSPLLATFAGVRGFDHLWDDFGPHGNEARRSRYAEIEERLSACERMHSHGREPDITLALRVLREHVDERRAFYASEDPYLDLNAISSTFQLLPMALDLIDVEGDRKDEGLVAIAARLETMGAACESYRALLAEGVARGHVVAQRQVRAAIGQGRLQTSEGDHYGALAERLGEGVEPALRLRLERGAKTARAAMAGLTDWLEQTYLPSACEREAVGRARYARAARRYLGASIDLEETYAWGFEEIRRIESAIADLIGPLAARLACDATTTAVVAALDVAPGSSLPLPAFLEAMQARQAEALASLEAHFDVPEPARRIVVKLAPPGGPVGAYYTAPSEDFARPGTVRYLPGSRTRMPLWSEITTAYHEGFPGHHLQIATQLFHRERLTRYQRLFADFTGYAEGWALYAEQLMLELGLLVSPEEILGMHLGQLARAYRVVLDIGLHLELPIPDDAPFHPGQPWTFDRAVEVMRDRAFLDPERATSEVIRYLGWPAQAITYKVGQRALLALREQRRTREGPSFDLRAFHAEVLATGMVGLDTLRATLLR